MVRNVPIFHLATQLVRAMLILLLVARSYGQPPVNSTVFLGIHDTSVLETLSESPKIVSPQRALRLCGLSNDYCMVESYLTGQLSSLYFSEAISAGMAIGRCRAYSLS